MSAEIEGALWTATCVQTAAWSSNILSIGATNGTQAISLGAFASGLGALNMSTGPANGSVTLLPTSAATWTAGMSGGSGLITLTRLNAQGATGTFVFTAIPVPGTGATGTKIVTGGVFDVTF